MFAVKCIESNKYDSLRPKFQAAFDFLQNTDLKVTLTFRVDHIVHHGHQVCKSLHVHYLPADRTAMPLTRNRPDTTDRV